MWKFFIYWDEKAGLQIMVATLRVDHVTETLPAKKHKKYYT